MSASVVSLDSNDSDVAVVSVRSPQSAQTRVSIGAEPVTPTSGSEETRVELPAKKDPTRVTDSMLSIDADPLIGFVISGRYRILERLGAGGMGMVYRVEHLHLGKLLALKLLSGELTRDESVQKRFKREAFLAAKLTHQNTVQVFDYGVSDGLTWLVMELVRGEDLSRMIRREGALPIDRAIPIMAQVCGSIEEAHSLGIIHRDLKPANIMLTRSLDGNDHAKVLDFGLAKLRNSSELNDVTSRGAVMGTPYYMAPEQIQAGHVDERADIYALGAVLYRLVTGEPVFAGAGPQQIFHGHLSLEPVPPHERAPTKNIPPALSAVILRALAKRPADRFQKVEQFRNSILRVLEEEQGSFSNTGDRHTIPVPRVFPENATRDEVAAYERKLERQRWISRAVVSTTLAIALYAAIGGYRYLSAPTFDGNETEPNDDAAHSNEIPFGRSVSGTIGKRIDREHPDVDFYKVTTPPGVDVISIRATSLPNMALCTLVFPRGEIEPIARLCPGRPRVDLAAPIFKLPAGSYYIAITQDRASHGKTKPDVVENVSDSYHLTIDRAREIKVKKASRTTFRIRRHRSRSGRRFMDLSLGSMTSMWCALR
ncbi:MAG: serine/threonine-protein kinase [Polyangiaceae bacterium]